VSRLRRVGSPIGNAQALSKEWHKYHISKEEKKALPMEQRLLKIMNKMNWNESFAMLQAKISNQEADAIENLTAYQAARDGFCVPPPRPPQPMPNEWDPNPWASALLFIVVCGHVLFHLLTYWLVPSHLINPFILQSILFGARTRVMQRVCSA
jgi:hypothetical protein